MEKIEIIVREEENGSRVDKLVSTLYAEHSRSQVQTWVKDGHLLVDGTTVKANHKVRTGEKVVIQIPEVVELDILPEAIPLEIYHEDADVLVVNKPKGMVVHPAVGHATGTLVNALMHHCQDLSGINGVMRPGIVHRIDRDTSGLLMVAKSDLAHEKLVEQLQNKTVTRKYKALVHGVIPHEAGTIDAPIGRDKKDRQAMTVTDENSRRAVTHFHVLERFQQHTLVECQLETGRTHQIRVHMKYIGYPLVGDPKYGPRKTLAIGGQALHAAVLGFQHPRSGVYLEFAAPLPQSFTKVLETIRVQG